MIKPPTLPRRTFEVQISIELPRLECFNCQTLYSLTPQKGEEQPERLTIVKMPLGISTRWRYQVEGAATDAEILAHAAAHGWHKITLCGKTLFVCPDCRLLDPAANTQELI